jgi:Glyoxalase-like domain
VARFWSSLLGGRSTKVVMLVSRPSASPTPNVPTLPPGCFERVSERKTIKNRLHLDFRPDNQDAEAERMLALGATRTEIGQGEQACLVRRDPEGNEFCVFGLRAL